MSKDYYFSIEFPTIVTADSPHEARLKLSEQIDEMIFNGEFDSYIQDINLWDITKTESNKNK